MEYARDALGLLRIYWVKKTCPVEGGYLQRHGHRLSTHRDIGELRSAIEEQADSLAAEFPQLRQIVEHIIGACRVFAALESEFGSVWSAYQVLVDLVERELGLPGASKGLVELSVFDDGVEIGFLLDADSRYLDEPKIIVDRTEFLSAVSHVLAHRRARGEALTKAEHLMLRAAYCYLSEGDRPAIPYRGWGVSGFRDRQTYMSITDPGEGHLAGTTTENKYLDGVIVHVEHLERGTVQDRERVEPYRMPAIHMLAKVRLHAGIDASVSSYVGRPMFEYSVEESMLKTVHTFAASCSAVFMDGIAECKLAIERMTARQAIDFMRSVSVAVRRDRYTQILSAAFNINTPILDDRVSTVRRYGGPVMVSDRFAVGMLSVELAAQGGFDKVTWDGTANSYPSYCVIEQLTYDQAVSLVHHAHEQGLLTYFSAGFRFNNLPQAVWTGVDGVGVGGAQILRYMDQSNGHHGPFLQENIVEILNIRNRAERTTLGRAALMLARLDRMYYERSISRADDELRGELFTALRGSEPDDPDPALTDILDRLAHVEQLPSNSSHPLVAWADRLVQAGDSSVAAELIANQWNRVSARLRSYVRVEDYDQLAEELSTIRARHVITSLSSFRLAEVADSGRDFQS